MDPLKCRVSLGFPCQSRVPSNADAQMECHFGQPDRNEFPVGAKAAFAPRWRFFQRRTGLAEGAGQVLFFFGEGGATFCEWLLGEIRCLKPFGARQVGGVTWEGFPQRLFAYLPLLWARDYPVLIGIGGPMWVCLFLGYPFGLD